VLVGEAVHGVRHFFAFQHLELERGTQKAPGQQAAREPR
jgi:hypothetical protein